MRARRGEQFPGSSSRMCRLRVDPGGVQKPAEKLMESSQSFAAHRAPGLFFGEGLVCRGINHLRNDVQGINRKLQLVK